MCVFVLVHVCVCVLVRVRVCHLSKEASVQGLLGQHVVGGVELSGHNVHGAAALSSIAVINISRRITITIIATLSTITIIA